MRLSAEQNKEIMRELGTLSEDNRKAEFYYHKVFDNDASTGMARDKAILEAQEKTEMYNKNREPENYKFFDPDFSNENLKKLGATAVYKDVLYIKIGHFGSKDSKSRKATEQDKQLFSKEWEIFSEQEKNNTKESNQKESHNQANDYQTSRSQRPAPHQNSCNQPKEIPLTTSGQEHNPQSFGIEFNYSFNL